MRLQSSPRTTPPDEEQAVGRQEAAPGAISEMQGLVEHGIEPRGLTHQAGQGLTIHPPACSVVASGSTTLEPFDLVVQVRRGRAVGVPRQGNDHRPSPCSARRSLAEVELGDGAIAVLHLHAVVGGPVPVGAGHDPIEGATTGSTGVLKSIPRGGTVLEKAWICS